MAACCSPATRRTGARGGNGGIQDADNLGWKLALVLQGRASDTLLDSYSAERKHAALENIRQARRSSRFVHPGPAESARMWRDAIIAGPAPRRARAHDQYRPALHAGHLSAVAAGASRQPACGTRAATWCWTGARSSLHQLLGPWFTALVFGDPVPDIPEPAADDALLRRVTVGAHCDAEGREALRRQLGVEMNGEVWLIRPDQHVMAAVDAAARASWRRPAGLDRRRAYPRPPASPDAHSPSNAGAHAHAPVAAAA